MQTLPQKKKLYSITLFIVSFLSLFLLNINTAFAAEEEEDTGLLTDLSVLVDLDPEATTVTNSITIRNEEDSSTGISQYRLVLGVANPKNITATRDNKAISVNVEKTETSTTITANLGSYIIPANDAVTLDISYTDDSIVSLHNNSYAASIPGFSVDQSHTNTTN